MTSRWFNFPNWWSFVYWTPKIFRLKKQSCVWISGKTRRNLFWWINPLFSHQVTSLCVHGKWDQPITIKVYNFQFSISLTWCFMRIHTKFGAIGLVRLLTLHWISISKFFCSWISICLIICHLFGLRIWRTKRPVIKANVHPKKERAFIMSN